MRFRAIALDLFGTLVRWRPESLPAHEFRGQEIRTTQPLLFPLLEEALGERFDRDAWLASYGEEISAIQEERLRRGIEVTCEERFRRVLGRLRDGEVDVDALAARLARRHMQAVREVTAAPPEWTAAVRAVAPRFRLGLLSNFDDAATGHAIVGDTGVGELFETVLISAEVGIRKPNPEIFRILLGRLDLPPEDVLFVGDTVLEDVIGAQGVGMPVAWISGRKDHYPADVPPPEFTLETLEELPGLVA